MKNQYFGDKRDYFKFDLTIFLAETLREIERFTYVPMLTKDDGSKQGGKTHYMPMGGDPILYTFLQKCTNEQRRDIRHIRAFFSRRNYDFEFFFYDLEDAYFTDGKRESYFARIPFGSLQNAVILVDPDIGMETEKTKSSRAHLKYEEVDQLYSRINGSSILVIYQHFPREPREQSLVDRLRRLSSAVACPRPTAIHDNDIVFIVLAKSEQCRLEVARMLRAYKAKRGNVSIFEEGDGLKNESQEFALGRKDKKCRTNANRKRRKRPEYRRIPLRMMTGEERGATAYGNNAAWVCSCNEVLLGPSREAVVYSCCCGRSYRVLSEAGDLKQPDEVREVHNISQ